MAQIVFDPNTMMLADILEELNQGAENAFDENAQAMIEGFHTPNCPQNSVKQEVSQHDTTGKCLIRRDLHPSEMRNII